MQSDLIEMLGHALLICFYADAKGKQIIKKLLLLHDKNWSVLQMLFKSQQKMSDT